MAIISLYVMFLMILGFIAAYLWLNRNNVFGLDMAQSRRLTKWTVPFLVVDIIFTAGTLWIKGPDNFLPIIGLIVGGLVLPVIGLIIVQETFD
ncbi:conserved membrane hypothetical protein [Weissella viridescens]|nr:hypothetical protein [Weissella viridescens]GEA94526.1 hypothetical protein WVI01_04490 [Weissella viridescens]SOB42305.1 conserved membrane hypothetical protein [Weissella viridescens]